MACGILRKNLGESKCAPSATLAMASTALSGAQAPWPGVHKAFSA
ncbi:hypothetical protein CCHR01_05614 [Colletotrichum chrysophilum]|uniref:Uncharacterized protein n=1 Tax=Colletotrichum chrysophilum TaxID=1836956 RepID=A0AAD9AQ69_9PEZI|nr:hypothetical protein CCHR01_05614 [Colletotrichum chrysophilum]